MNDISASSKSQSPAVEADEEAGCTRFFVLEGEDIDTVLLAKATDGCTDAEFRGVGFETAGLELIPLTTSEDSIAESDLPWIARNR